MNVYNFRYRLALLGFSCVITIIEKSLDHICGHEQTQIRAIKNLFRNEEFLILTASSSSIQLPTTNNILRVLSSRREHRKNTSKALSHDVTALQNILTGSNYPKCTGVLIPTAETPELLICMELIARNKSLPIFALRILNQNIIEKLNKTQRTDLQICIEAGSIILVTETKSLEDFLLSQYSLRAHNNFLLPCSIDPDDAVLPHDERNRQHFKIGYLGGFRKEKGAYKLPNILADLKTQLNDSETKITLELVMQEAKHKTAIRRMIYQYKLVRSLNNSLFPDRAITIKMLDKELSPHAFIEAVSYVDILLIPYELKAYHARGSGIIIDGVLAEKPIVYTGGIGMDEFLGFGNAESAANISEFAPQLMKVIRNLGVYRAKATLARAAMRTKIQESATFLEQLNRSPRYFS